ncbi:MAG: urea carboxylase-associated family protein [Actinomycetota bacterium]|nr:urea carboxylase-associated family protein [Actinomycetota bacterium]MDH5223910.1 urea carboxylase-associated family protein [Actinomycetota bacterium]MDH5312375.1 urea carboxylase-associated family protein [Actinomycetota bacterium]
MTTRIDVPAREGRAIALSTGDAARVIDTEGGQVADVFAFVAEDPREYARAGHTRVGVARLFPWVGESFVTNRRRPILAFEEDTSPGFHDLLCAACDPTRYELLGAGPGHASCQDNLLRATARLGFDDVEVPQPINVFMRTPPQPDGTIAFLPALSRPGDHVTFRAALDVILVVSACPMDLNPVNNENPTGLAIELDTIA